MTTAMDVTQHQIHLLFVSQEDSFLVRLASARLHRLQQEKGKRMQVYHLQM